MSCEYPVKCPYYKNGKCSIPPDKFQEMCEKGNNPCEQHVIRIEQECLRDAREAFARGDAKEAEYIFNPNIIYRIDEKNIIIFAQGWKNYRFVRIRAR